MENFMLKSTSNTEIINKKYEIDKKNIEERYKLELRELRNKYINDLNMEALYSKDVDNKKDEIINLYCDGACPGNGKRGAIGGAGAVAYNSNGETVKEFIEKVVGDKVTNNIAEYKSLIIGLRGCLNIGASSIKVHMDSKLVVEQIRGNYKVKDPILADLHRECKILQSKFRRFSIVHVYRNMNSRADFLANEGLRI